MTGQAYSGGNGNRYTISAEIGRGGEGRVCAVKEDTALVVKLYTETLTPAKVAKLRYMVGMSNTELTRYAAWPIDIVTDAAQRVCGFVMKRLDGYVPLHMLFTPMDRKNIFPDKGYNFLVHVARNLAIAFHKIHAAGLIIGDINEGNILVNAQGMVVLIDCDSFQVQSGDSYYFCEVGIPRYTPPELLQHSTFNNVVRTVNTDSFSLAILIFQLLFLGRHPFTGRNLTAEDIDEEKAIKTFEFAYSLRKSNKKLTPPKNSFDLNELGDSIVELFHNSFEKIPARPLPKDWIAQLDILYKDLRTCPHSRLHFYPGKAAECPWCAFKNRTGTLYFLDDSYAAADSVLNDIDTFIQGFRIEKIELKSFPADHVVSGLTVAPIDKSFTQLKVFNRKWLAFLLVATICLWFIKPQAIIVGMVFIIIFYLRSPATLKLKAELLARQNIYLTLKAQFQAFIQQANHPAEIVAYNKILSGLNTIISNFTALPAAFNARKKLIEQKHYEDRYNIFLRNFDITQHTIPSIGPVKKEAILNSGIRTAADIDRLSTIKVPGIGPKNIQILQNWQRQVGSGFTYIPDLLAMKRDTELAMYETAKTKRILEEDIKREYAKLQPLKANISTYKHSIEAKYQSLKRDVYQAELDHKAFERYTRVFV